MCVLALAELSLLLYTTLAQCVSPAMEGEEVNSSFAVAVNATADNSYSLQAYQTAIFIVVLLGEFLASLVGNVILIAMIIKTRKFQNTINIFLTGFEVSYLQYVDDDYYHYHVGQQ